MTNNEDSWLSIKRALIILQQLQKRPSSRQELVQAVQNAIPDAYRQPTESAQRRAFERDLNNLRNRLNVKIPPWDRNMRVYYLLDAGPFAQLDFTEDILTSIAFILETFGPDHGAHEIMQPLLRFLEKNLASDQLRRLDRQTDPLRMNLSRLDTGVISPAVWEKVRYAVKQRRMVEFNYLSPRHEYPEPRYHCVEPFEIRFERGHYYLRAYCVRWRNPEGYEGGNRWFSYRLDHILSQEFNLLPNRVQSRSQRLLPIRYKIAPRLWRGGVTQHFEEMVVGEPDSSGWVEIQAKVEDLFQAHRVLLAYGELCQAVAPDELVEMMKTAVFGISQLYNSD